MSEVKFSENLVNAISHNGSNDDFSKWYHGCVYERSWRILNLGDLDLEVKVRCQVFQKTHFSSHLPCEYDISKKEVTQHCKINNIGVFIKNLGQVRIWVTLTSRTRSEVPSFPKTAFSVTPTLWMRYLKKKVTQHCHIYNIGVLIENLGRVWIRVTVTSRSRLDVKFSNNRVFRHTKQVNTRSQKKKSRSMAK